MIVLFDLGNVIVRPINVEELYNRLEAKIPFEHFLDYWRNDKIIYDAHQGLVTDDYHVEKLLQYTKSNKTVVQFYEIYQELFRGIFQDSIDLALELKNRNIPIGVLSNLREMDFRANSQDVDFSIFDYLFLSYKMKILKPNENIYKEVIETCKVEPNEIYFFDDLEENVEGAKKLGINAYCTTGNEIKEFFSKLNLI